MRKFSIYANSVITNVLSNKIIKSVHYKHTLILTFQLLSLKINHYRFLSLVYGKDGEFLDEAGYIYAFNDDIKLVKNT